MKLIGEVKDVTVSQAQLARALGISKQRVGQLIDEGIVIRDETSTDGRVWLLVSLRNYFLSKNPAGDDVSFWKERSLHEKAKRELAELKLSKSRGEVYDAATVESVLTELLTNFKNKLLGVPSKYAPQLEGKSRAEIYSMLTAAIEEELTELSEGVKNCDFDEESGDAEENSAASTEADA